MQQPISTVSQRGQACRLTYIVRSVLEAYPLPVARVTPLKQVYNNNFRIDTQGGEKYMLRIYHPRRTSVEPVLSELLWLAALNQETDLRVPGPVLNREAQYVTVISDPDFEQPRMSVLFRWTDGRFLNRTLTPAHLFQVGELMANLHNHAAHWDRPTGFTRRRVDNLFCLRQQRDDTFDEKVAKLAVQTVESVSTPQDGELVAEVIHKAWAVLQGLGEGADNFGLIHADVHQWNYLFYQGQVGVIDFDDCGFGHWLYDLSVTLYCLQNHPHFSSLRKAFLAGYRQRRALSIEHEALLETFMALRTLQDLQWDIEEQEQSAFRDTWYTRMMGGLQALGGFVNQ